MELFSNVSSLGANAGSLVANISLATAVACGVLVALFFFALRYGKDRIIALIFALYIGLLASLYFPYGEKVAELIPAGKSGELPQIILFVVFVIMGYLAVFKSVFAEYPRGGMRYLQAGVFAIASTALLLAFSYAVLPVATAYNFDLPVSGVIFERPEYFFWWLIAPLLAVFFFGRD